ncbi:hypothetical protein ACHQM5_010945 [Ranunculus cassubicifolius]
MSRVTESESEVGPDLFAYYTREIEELFSQKDHVPSVSPRPVTSAGTLAIFEDSGSGDSNSKANELPGTRLAKKLFCNGVGDSLSVLKEERVKASLKQSVKAFGKKTNETLKSVLDVIKTKKQLVAKECVTKTSSPTNSMSNQSPCKKQKISSSLSSAGVAIQSGTPGTFSGKEVIKSLRSLVDIDESVISDEKLMENADFLLKTSSDELHEKMENMEQQLENYLNVITSNCRKMTIEEKVELRNLIEKLPTKNLDRVVDIILQRRKLPEGEAGNVLHVDLENEDNVTLWRLYYYVEAVERAKHLAAIENEN